MAQKKITSDLIQQYQYSFAKHGDSPAAVMWPRGRQELRFDALTKHFSGSNFSVLDFGCGLGHLKDYLDKHYINYKYYGVDVVPEFVKWVSEKYVGIETQLINSYLDLLIPVDHIVISGTFNIIEGGDRLAYIKQVEDTLIHLFGLSRLSLSVNFMTDRVDFTQPDALHMNVEFITDFIRSHLSPRIIVNESYMPYEFTIITIKDNEIIRPENIYKKL
jgi:SAM-dependent methyltransferase